MKPKTLAQLKHRIETYGDWHGGEVMLIKYQQEYIAALEARLAALEPSQPVAPVEINKGVQSALTKDFVWPPPADVCRCEEGFEGEALVWNCKRCGGSRF